MSDNIMSIKWGIYDGITQKRYDFNDDMNKNSSYCQHFKKIGLVLGRSHEPEIQLIIQDRDKTDRFNHLHRIKQKSLLNLGYHVNEKYKPLMFNMNSGRAEINGVIHIKFRIEEESFKSFIDPSMATGLNVLNGVNDSKQILEWLTNDCYEKKKGDWNDIKNAKTYRQIRSDLNDYMKYFGDKSMNISDIFPSEMIEKYKNLHKYLEYKLDDIEIDNKESEDEGNMISRLQLKIYIKNANKTKDDVISIIIDFISHLNELHPPLIDHICNKYNILDETEKDDIRWHELVHLNDDIECKDYVIVPMMTYIPSVMIFGASSISINQWIRKYINTVDGIYYNKYKMYKKVDCDNPHYMFYIDINEKKLLYLNKIGKYGKNKQIIYHPKFQDGVYKYRKNQSLNLRHSGHSKNNKSSSHSTYYKYDSNKYDRSYYMRSNNNNNNRYPSNQYGSNQYGSNYYGSDYYGSNHYPSNHGQKGRKRYRNESNQIIPNLTAMSSAKMAKRRKKFDGNDTKTTSVNNNNNNSNSVVQPPANKKRKLSKN